MKDTIRDSTAFTPLPVLPGLAPGPEHRVPSLPEVNASVRISRSPQYCGGWQALSGRGF